MQNAKKDPKGSHGIGTETRRVLLIIDQIRCSTQEFFIPSCCQSPMNTIEKLGRGVRWTSIWMLVLFAPFHAFLITWLKSLTISQDFIMMISMWREILVVATGVLFTMEWLVKRTWPKFDRLDMFIFGFALLALGFFPVQGGKPLQWLWGFRFDVLPLLFFVFIRHGTWLEKEKFTKWFLGIATIVIIFGLLHSLVLPKNFLTNFGYSENREFYKPGVPIAACQFLEHSQQVCRATSTFGGPLRYGTYLLLVLGILFPFLKEKTSWRFVAWTLFGLAMANSILTYSRSIWIGLAVMFLAWLFIDVHHHRVMIGSLFILLIALIPIFQKESTPGPWQKPSLLESIFLRETSTSEHVQLMKQGLQKIKEKPLGMGLGTAGPASLHFEKFLTENWYLQIGIEMGVLGLILFLSILFSLFKKLLDDPKNSHKIGLFLSLVGISIAGLFTHAFEETTTVLIFFGFSGIFLSPRQS